MARKLSAETKAKMSASQKARAPASAETRARISASQKLKKPASAETRARISAAKLGKTRTFSAEHIANLCIAGKGRIVSAETRAKLSASNTGKIRSAEAKAKVSASNTGKIRSVEVIEKIRARQLGKKASKESIDKRRSTNMKRYGATQPPLAGRGKKSWEQIGGQKFYARSTWEANYANYLEVQKTQGLILKWEHEPETFWFNKIKRGVRSYLPDFRITLNSGAIEFHEIKGYMDSKSLTKIKRMKIYHPDVVLKVIDSKAYKALEKKIQSITPNWK